MPECLVILATGEARHQQSAKNAKGRRAVDRRAGTAAHLGVVLHKEVGNCLNAFLDLGINWKIWIFKHHGDPQFPQVQGAWRWQLELPGNGVVGSWPRDQRERRLEIFCAAGERPSHAEVRLAADARHDVTDPIGNALGRLVTVDPQ